MKTLDELIKLKEASYQKVQMRQTYDSTKVFVAMGTCGIAAGARDIVDAFIDELAKSGNDGVMVSTSGCLGQCDKEPMVEVVDAQGNSTVYAKVTKEAVAEIVKSHIENGKVVEKYTLGKAE